MIAWLEGRLLRKMPDAVVVEVGGVGYRVFVSKQVLSKLPPEGSLLELEIHTQVREDAISLFGFIDGDEREAFKALIGMSGMGPRAAISVLSGIDARELARAVCSKDLARLCMIQGVGKKKAERMVLDLKEKLMPLAQPQKGGKQGIVANLEDLRSALKNLGFKGPEVEKAIGTLREQVVSGADMSILLPEALKLLRG